MIINKEMLKASLLLYAVTDRAWCGKKTLKEQVAEAIEGGITFLQIREKDLSDEDFLQEAIEIGQLAREHNIPFVMNWTVFSKKYKSFIYYHMKASFATGYFIPHCARRPSIRSSINNVSLCGISGHSDSPASIAFIQLRTSYS